MVSSVYATFGEPLVRSLPALMLLCQVVGLCGCGRTQKISPLSSPPPITAGTLPRVQTVRVLLSEDFKTLEVKGSSLAPSLLVRVIEEGLECAALGEDETLVFTQISGFRLQPVQGSLLEVDGTLYRGWVDVFLNPLGIPVAVNEVGIEDYLKSVVPNELGPATYPFLQAQRAQAVAARTFAVRNLGMNARFGYDLYGDERSQLYSGAESEHALSSRGVEETTGMVAVYQGNPIWALYSSTCGGKTEAYHLVFKGERIEYLKGGVICHDEMSPYHFWEEWIEICEIQPDLDRYAKVGRLKKLEPVTRSETGRIIEMAFTGELGRNVLRGNDVRFALGLRSSLILQLTPVLDPRGYIQRLHVVGKGWGHGVGMCQLGAVELASRDKSYDQILRHYYPGIEVTRWY